MALSNEDNRRICIFYIVVFSTTGGLTMLLSNHEGIQTVLMFLPAVIRVTVFVVANFTEVKIFVTSCTRKAWQWLCSCTAGSLYWNFTCRFGRAMAASTILSSEWRGTSLLTLALFYTERGKHQLKSAAQTSFASSAFHFPFSI